MKKYSEMLPVLINLARAYAHYVVWPFAFVVGAVGYKLEWYVRGDKPTTPSRSQSIADERGDRLLETNQQNDPTHVDTLREKKFVPKTSLGRNDPGPECKT